MSYGWLTNQVFSGLPGGNGPEGGSTGSCQRPYPDEHTLFTQLVRMSKEERNEKLDQMMDYAREHPEARGFVWRVLARLDETLEDEDLYEQEEDKYEEIKNLTKEDRKDIYDYAMERSKILLEDKNDRE